jgi:hypothetical protein
MTYLTITPDQLASAGSYIAREWGDYGYSIERIESPTRRVSMFHVVASDGARFIVLTDRYGNARHVDSNGYDSPEQTALLTRVVAAMHANSGN